MAGKTTQLDPEKVKIVSVTPQMKDGVHKVDDFGNFRFNVKFEGKDVQYGIIAKDNTAKSWPVGQEVDITSTKWESEDGSMVFYNAKLVKKEGPYNRFGGGGGAAPKGAKEYKAEAILKAAECAASILSVRENSEDKDIPVYFKAFVVIMHKEIDTVFAEVKK